MTGTPQNKKDLAAWQSLIAPLETGKLILAALLFVASALMLPLSQNQTLSVIYICALAVFFYMQTQRLGALLSYALPAFALFMLSGSVTLPAAFFALVFGGACGTLVLLSLKKPTSLLLAALLPAAAYAIALLLKMDPINALLVLLPLPLAIVGTVAIRRLAGFTGAVAAMGTVLAATLAVAGIVTLAVMQLLDLSLLPTFIELLAKGIVAMMEESAKLYAEAGITMEILFTVTDVKNMLSVLVNLLPGLLGVTALVTAFFTWRTLSVLLVTFGVLPRLPRVMAMHRYSVVGAVVFLLATVVQLFADGVTPTGMVAQNLSLILSPGLLLITGGVLFGKDRERSCMSLVYLILLVYLVWSNPGLALSLASCYGAIHVLLAAWGEHKVNRKGEP